MWVFSPSPTYFEFGVLFVPFRLYPSAHSLPSSPSEQFSSGRVADGKSVEPQKWFLCVHLGSRFRGLGIPGSLIFETTGPPHGFWRTSPLTGLGHGPQLRSLAHTWPQILSLSLVWSTLPVTCSDFVC